MSRPLPEHFTHNHVLADDGAISFECPTDSDVWPWLTLHPFDPIVVQTLNYYASYEVAMTRGHYERGQWTALTRTAWTCGDTRTGHAARGVAFATAGDGSAGFEMCFYDLEDRLVYEMSGEGVVFRNRDFDEWRSGQKQVFDVVDEREFSYAPADAVGVRAPVESYVSMPLDSPGRRAQGLITGRNGFPPAHPYQDGSGDHVNASHLADACRQYLRLVLGEPHRIVTGGEMAFTRYVELGCPFDMEMISNTEMSDDPRHRNTIEVQIRQLGRLCSTIQLQHTGE